MNYVLVGVNHKTAPVGIREKMALSGMKRDKLLSRLVTDPAIHEASVISTCNRVELYGATEAPRRAQAVLTCALCEPIGDVESVRTLVYAKADHDAVTHLFRVAASLDSQVMGETQITGQVKEAHRTALKVSASGYYLNKLFDRALFVAKRVKSETDISRGHVSVGSVGVALAKKIFGSLEDKTVLLLGAGKLGELTIRYLNTERVKKTIIVNRDFSRAKRLEDEGLGMARSMADLRDLLADVDVLITSISGTVRELHESAFKELMARRKNQPLFIIDLGVPRNVEPSVAAIDNLYLYNIDDLEELAKENSKLRSRAMAQAKNIIDEEVRLFYEKHIEFKALPAIARLGRKFDEIRRVELKRTLSKLAHLSERDRAAIDKLTQVLVNRLLHDPILSLKQSERLAEPGLVTVFKRLFRLDDEG